MSKPEPRVIGVTAPVTKENFDDEDFLHQHGAMFSDGTFVCYADMNYKHLQALHSTYVDDVAQAWNEAAASQKAILLLTESGAENLREIIYDDRFYDFFCEHRDEIVDVLLEPGALVPSRLLSSDTLRKVLRAKFDKEG
jgi:hypothetical protein